MTDLSKNSGYKEQGILSAQRFMGDAVKTFILPDEGAPTRFLMSCAKEVQAQIHWGCSFFYTITATPGVLLSVHSME